MNFKFGVLFFFALITQLNCWAQKSFAEIFSQVVDSSTYSQKTKSMDTAVVLKSGSSNKVDDFLSLAKSFIGTPYRYGGTTERGFDCSGFVNYVCKWFNIKLPRSSGEISLGGLQINYKNLQKGDLVFFYNKKKGSVGHVGIILEVTENAIKMIHASRIKGVTIDDILNSAYYQKHFITAKRFTDITDH